MVEPTETPSRGVSAWNLRIMRILCEVANRRCAESSRRVIEVAFLTREAVEESPGYDPSALSTVEAEEAVYKRYGPAAYRNKELSSKAP